jgi:ABC-2 type transport system permease protein
LVVRICFFFVSFVPSWFKRFFFLSPGGGVMHATWTVFRRELASYFATPLAYIFIVIFLALAGTLTFFVGGFFERGQADLQPFFNFHPWLYLVLIPALAMRLWAEERKSGTIELFLTLPISIGAAVAGKFLAAWAFAGIALALTFPFWISVNVLGSPDNGVILASYIGSFLMAGGFLAIGSCLSALTKNQVIAFVVTAAVCFLFTVSGSTIVLGFLQGWAPDRLVSTIASFSFLTHFSAIVRGVIDMRDAVFFASVIGLFLLANVILVDLKKAD